MHNKMYRKTDEASIHKKPYKMLPTMQIGNINWHRRLHEQQFTVMCW